MNKIGSFFTTVLKPMKTLAKGVDSAAKGVGHVVKDVAKGDVHKLGKDAISLATTPAKTTMNVAKENLSTLGKGMTAVKNVAGKVIKYSPAGLVMDKTKPGKAFMNATSKVGNVAYKGLSTIVKNSPAGLAVRLGQSGKLGSGIKSLADNVSGTVDNAFGQTVKTALTSKSFSDRTLATADVASTFVPGAGAAAGAARLATTAGKVAEGAGAAGKAAKIGNAAKLEKLDTAGDLISGPGVDALMNRGNPSKGEAFSSLVEDVDDAMPSYARLAADTVPADLGYSTGAVTGGFRADA